MRKTILGIALIAAIGASALLAPSAQAQTYPQVANLTAFTTQANYMSLPGYLRYRYYLTSRTWISYEEAARIVREQQGN